MATRKKKPIEPDKEARNPYFSGGLKDLGEERRRITEKVGAITRVTIYRERGTEIIEMVNGVRIK